MYCVSIHSTDYLMMRVSTGLVLKQACIRRPLAKTNPLSASCDVIAHAQKSISGERHLFVTP